MAKDCLDVGKLRKWLAPLDACPVECDGMTRAVATLLKREGIPFTPHCGSLTIPEVGHIPLHFWIELDNGLICDYRAQMWLGSSPSVPHGIFKQEADHQYHSDQWLDHVAISPTVFLFVTGLPLDSFPPLESFVA